MKHVRMPKRLRVLAWNAKVGRPTKAVVRALRWWIRIRRPHVIALNEANGYVGELRAAFGDKYRLRKTRDVVALIRRDLPKPVVERVGHDIAWVGPKQGKKHKGRRFLILRFPGLTLAVVHRTPGGPTGGTSPTVAGKNRRAWRAEDALIEDLFDASDDPTYVIGDQNATRREMHPHVVRVNAVLVAPPKTHVDYGYGRGVLRAVAQRLGRGGSDHPANLHDIPIGEAA